MTNDEIGTAVVDAAYIVHKELGPGLLEQCYETCLEYELTQKGLYVQRQVEIPVNYKEVELETGYKADLIVENQVILELKAVEEIHDVFFAQLMTYMKLGNFKLGYLINFNVPLIKNGIYRRKI